MRHSIRAQKAGGIASHHIPGPVGPDIAGSAEVSDESLVVDGYNAVYAGGPDSPTLQRIWLQHACGPGYPAEYGHISFLTVSEAQLIARESRLGPGDRLVDLACGAGGPGLTTPAAPAQPGAPGAAGGGGQPQLPNLPNLPHVPKTPNLPNVPGVPNVPGLGGLGGLLGGGQNSGGGGVLGGGAPNNSNGGGAGATNDLLNFLFGA
jgi:hypothetical protein